MQNDKPCPQLKSTETESEPFEILKGGATHHVHVERKLDFESCPDKVTLQYRKKGSSGEWRCRYVLNKLKEGYFDEKLDNRVLLKSNEEYRIVTDKQGVEVWIDTGGLQGSIKPEINDSLR